MGYRVVLGAVSAQPALATLGVTATLDADALTLTIDEPALA
jgi:hypothetical protein